VLELDGPAYQKALERHQPGETVKLAVLRGGKPVELSVRLGLADQLQ